MIVCLRKAFSLSAVLTTLFVLLFTGCGKSNAPVLSVTDLISQADQYNGKTVTVDGVYLHGWESTLLTEDVAYEASGKTKELQPAGQSIWFAGMIPLKVQDSFYKHSISESETQTFGKVRVTGLFEAGGPYGYLKASKYRITATDVELLDWKPPK